MQKPAPKAELRSHAAKNKRTQRLVRQWSVRLVLGFLSRPPMADGQLKCVSWVMVTRIFTSKPFMVVGNNAC